MAQRLTQNIGPDPWHRSRSPRALKRAPLREALEIEKLGSSAHVKAVEITTLLRTWRPFQPQRQNRRKESHAGIHVRAAENGGDCRVQ